MAYHGKDNLKILVNTFNFFKKVIPNINYVSKSIKKIKNHKKIKVGFISEFLTRHTIGKLFGGLIKNIDRKKFDVTIFYTSKTKKDSLKDRIDNSADKSIKISERLPLDKETINRAELFAI